MYFNEKIKVDVKKLPAYLREEYELLKKAYFEGDEIWYEVYRESVDEKTRSARICNQIDQITEENIRRQIGMRWWKNIMILILAK